MLLSERENTARSDVPLVCDIAELEANFAPRHEHDYSYSGLEQIPDGPPEEQVKIAHAILIGGLRTVSSPVINIEQESIDGAVVLMPQVARTLGWHQEVTVLVISTFVVKLLQIVAAFSLLLFVDKEENVFDAFADQPYLCDFGINVDQCDTEKSGPQCVGPGGTPTTAPRIYSFSLWSTRKFVRDSLLTLLPDKADDINKLVDPGEYALESYWCRLLCCILLILSIKDELYASKKVIELLWYLPNRNQDWVESKTHDASLSRSGHNWTEAVSIKVAGMSSGWKLWNVFFVVLPKISVVYLTGRAGVFFLMETASIDDLIVNSVAFGFILGLDNLMVNCLTSSRVRTMVDLCEGVQITLEGQNWHMSDRELIKEFQASRGNWTSVLFAAFTRELVTVYSVFGITSIFVYFYYVANCEIKDGRWVSREIHHPKSTRYWGGHFLLPWFFSIPSKEDAAWGYPD